MHQRFKVLLMAVTLLILFSSVSFNSPVLAQAGATSGNVTGVVSDGQGARIGGASVTITSTTTNLRREATSSEDGDYNIAQLPPGIYEVKISANGFKDQTFRITLELGTIAKISPVLELGDTGDVVVVEGGSSSLQEEKTESSTNQDRNRIDNLPINRRNFLDFALTSPRVTQDRIPPNGITSTSGLSFNGQSARFNNITIDGNSNNDNFTNGVRSSVSQDAVQEFQIVSDSYSAEFGRAIGGVVNIVTRSGSNEFHGTVFNFLRNDSTSARDVFVAKAPEYKQYQFGGALSGPIKKDKAFFFLSFERLSIRQNSIVSIPDQVIKAIQSQGYQNVVNGAIPFSVGTATVLARGDFQLKPSDRLSVRYNGGFTYDGAFETIGASLGGFVSPSSGGALRLKDNSFNFNNVFVRNGFVNETRFLVARRDQKVTSLDDSLPLVLLTSAVGQIAFGNNFLTPQKRKPHIYQFVDIVTMIKGRNQLKFGADFNYVSAPDKGTNFPINAGGFYSYQPINFSQAFGMPGLPSLTALEAFDPSIRTPAQLGFLQALTTILPQALPGFPQGVPFASSPLPAVIGQLFGDTNVSVDSKLFSAFVQDDIKIAPNFLLKLGLRYEVFRVSGVPTNSGNFSPRVAFSYRPKFLNNLSITGAYGVFYGGSPNLQLAVLNKLYNTKNVSINPNPALNQFFGFPFTVPIYLLPNHRFPTAGGAAPGAPPPGIPFFPQFTQSYQFDPNFKNSYSQQATFTVKYLIEKNTLLSFDFNSVRGLKLFSARYINPVIRPTGNPLTSGLFGRVNPNAGFVFEFESAFDSYYNGFTASVNHRLANNFSLFAAYTFSRGIDDTVDFRTDLDTENDSLLPAKERSLSLQDARNRFVASGTWQLNYTKNPIFKDFQISVIASAISGRPYNILAGTDLNQNLEFNNGDRPPASGLLKDYSPDCGCLIGRNAGITPGFATFDLRLSRTFSFKERYRLNLSIEGFNLFNKVNISQINNIFPPDANGNFNLPPQEGGRYIVPKSRYTNAFSPRQFQIGMRFNF